MSIMAVSFCEETANIWKVIGEVLDIIRIVIPLIIIVLGMLDLGKIVISGDSKAMKESQKMFIKRLIYGLAIFFVTTIVKLVFSLVEANVAEDESKICWTCAARPNSKECTKYADKLIEENTTESNNEDSQESTEYIEEGAYENNDDATEEEQNNEFSEGNNEDNNIDNEDNSENNIEN